MCVLSGCTQYWYQPGVTLEQAQTDHRECFRNILQQAPVTAMDQRQMQDMNACMVEKGYSLVTAGQLPKSVDRVAPAASHYWKLYGVAGLPKEKSYPLFEY